MKQDRATELERIKRDADLRAVAAWLGYEEDHRASDRNHTAMRLGDHKLMIAVNRESGHWCWSDNQGNHGTAIDLVQAVRGGSLGEIRKALRPFIGESSPHPRFDRSRRGAEVKPRPPRGDAGKAKAEWDEAEASARSVFLEKSRGLPAEVLADARFADCFRVDARHNAVFPYRSSWELVAVERRNRAPQGSDRSFKSYTAGAVPGVWLSNTTPADSRLVIVESPIDAMSFHALQGDPRTRYLALRQGCSPEDLAAAVKDMPAGVVIVAATDADAQGRKYAQEICELARAAGYEAEVLEPDAKDWNEQLLQKQQQEEEPEPSLGV